MMEFIDNIAFVCLIVAVIGFVFLTMVGIFEFINYLSKGKFKNAVAHFFEEESDE